MKSVTHVSDPIANVYDAFIATCVDVQNVSADDCTGCIPAANDASTYTNQNGVSWAPSETCCQNAVAFGSGPVGQLGTTTWCCNSPSWHNTATNPNLYDEDASNQYNSFKRICQGLVSSVFDSECWDDVVQCTNYTITMPSFESFVAYFEDADGNYLSIPTTYNDSITPSTSVSPSITPTTTTTPSTSKSPSVSPSPTPTVTPSPTNLHYMLGTNWSTFKICDNLEEVVSYADSFPRDVVWPNVLLWNDMDARVSIDCVNTETDYDCEYLLKSSIRILQPNGYIGVRVWSTYNDVGSTKVLVVDNSYVWRSDMPSCTFQGQPCNLLEVSDPQDGTSNTLYLEFRMGIYPGRDNRTAPFVIEWIDETLIPHGMRPALSRSLDEWEYFPLSEGKDMSIDQFFDQSDSTMVVIVMGSFVGVLLLMLCVSCTRKPVVKRSERKLRYVVNTHGLRTIMKDTKNQLHHSQTYNRNKFTMAHVPFVLVILAWRLSYSVVFTFSFFSYMFTSINKEHFDTMDQWDAFTVDRDTQITTLIDNIELEYQAERTRLDSEYAYVEDVCNITSDMELAFLADMNAITAAHDDEQSLRQGSNVSSGDILTTASNAFACNLNNGAAYSSNSIQVQTLNGTSGTYYSTQWNATNKSTAEVMTTLTTVCIATSWCVGFSLDSTTSNYYLYSSFPDPPLASTAGLCVSHLAFQTNWDSASNSIDALNTAAISSFQDEVQEQFFTYNALIEALDSATTSETMQLATVIDHGSPNVSYGISAWSAQFSGGSGSAGNFHGIVHYACADGDCDPQTPPSLTLAEDGTYTFNSTYNTSLNTSYEVVTYFVDQASKVVNITEANYDWLEPPDWQFKFYDIDISDNLIMIAISVDVLLFMYRTLYTISLLAKYMRGLDRNIPAYYVMKREMQEKERQKLRRAAGGLGKLVDWSYTKVKNMGSETWMLIYKINVIMIMVMLLMVGFIAYWTVDNIIQPETFESFGVFSAMTAIPAAQQTLRNEQLAAFAFAYNSVGADSLQANVNAKANELMTRQDTFNSAQYTEVATFNGEFCTAMQGYIDVPVTLSTTSTDCCSTTIAAAASPVALGFDLDYTDETSIGLYVAPAISVALRWVRPTLTYENDKKNGCIKPTDLASFKKPIYVEVVLRHADGTVVYNTSQSWTALENVIDATSDPCTFPTWIHLTAFTDRTLTFTPALSSQTRASTISVTLRTEVDEYQVTSVSASGQLFHSDDYTCNEVAFQELDFQPDSFIGACRTAAPVSVHMISLFSRSNWTYDLTESHKPFVKAMRNIVLSPFYLILVGLGIVIFVMIFLAVLEFFMVKADMVRENAFVRVPCLIAKTNVDLENLEHARGHSLDPSRASLMRRDVVQMLKQEEKRKSLHGPTPLLQEANPEPVKPKLISPAGAVVGAVAPTRPGGRGRAASVVEALQDMNTVTIDLSAPVSMQEPPSGQHESDTKSRRRSSLGRRASQALSSVVKRHSTVEQQDLLPDDWAMVKTPDGRTYYYNETTSETTWERPRASVSLEQQIIEVQIQAQAAQEQADAARETHQQKLAKAMQKQAEADAWTEAEEVRRTHQQKLALAKQVSMQRQQERSVEEAKAAQADDLIEHARERAAQNNAASKRASLNDDATEDQLL